MYNGMAISKLEELNINRDTLGKSAYLDGTDFKSQWLEVSNIPLLPFHV